MGHFLDSQRCAGLFRSGLWGHSPYSCFMAITEIRWVLPAGAKGSQVAGWLGAEFGYCVIKCRQRSAAIMGKNLASPAIACSPGGPGAARLYSSNCFPHPGLIIVCRYLSWLPPGLADSLPPFSQETINPAASGRHWLSSSPAVRVQPLHLCRACQPGCFGAE